MGKADNALLFLRRRSFWAAHWPQMARSTHSTMLPQSSHRRLIYGARGSDRPEGQPQTLWLYLGLFGNLQCIVNFNPQVPYGAFQLRVAQQQLHCPQVLGSPVDQGGLGPAQRVRAVVGRIQPDHRHPAVDQAASISATSSRRVPCGRQRAFRPAPWRRS